MDTLTKEERYSFYDYQIWSTPDDDCPQKCLYSYKILDKGGVAHYYTGCPIIRESDEHFDSEGEASLAAIGHISLLEDGEG